MSNNLSPRFACGNSIHIKCMQVWAEHQKKTSPEGVIKCPMCREDFGPIDLLKTESRNAGCKANPPPGIRMDRHLGIMCSNCSKAPIEGKCYRSVSLLNLKFELRYISFSHRECNSIELCYSVRSHQLISTIKCILRTSTYLFCCNYLNICTF